MKQFFLRAFYLIIVHLCVYLQAHAQQDPVYSQYMFNGMIINPAYPSMDESSSLTVVGRNQWMGIDGAPKTATFSFYSPIKATSTSLGFSALSEKIGVQSRTGGNFHVSQRVKLNEKLYLAMGIKAGMVQYRENNSLLSTTDPVFAQDQRYWKTDIGFGFMLFTERFFAGFSAPTFRSFDIGKSVNKVATRTHYYFQAGYLFDLDDKVKFKPNVLVRKVQGTAWAYDLNVNVLLKNLVWLGASWRSEKTVTGLVQVQVSKHFQIGYAYDAPMASNLKMAQSASHELMLNYRFAWSKWRVVSPRYF